MKRLLFVSALALVACAPTPAPIEPPPLKPAGDPLSAGCPILGSSDWAAWVNAMPGPNARSSLIITGKVTVPTGGYQFTWADIQVMRSDPVQVTVELQVTAPTGPATQAILTHDLRGRWPMTPPVGSLTVYCGGQVLVRIAPVETAY